MRTKGSMFVAGALLAGLFGSLLAARDVQPPRRPAAGPVKAAGGADPDTEAIRKSSREFSQAFAKGDARAVAACWTEQGEYQDEGGAPIRGRAAIAKLFAAFFKEQPKSTIVVTIESIRFPARDLAIEEGLLQRINPGAELPSSSLYRVTHVRADGRWRIATAREWGAGRDRLADLDWLLGRWKAAFKDREVVLSFAKDRGKPFLVGQFTKKDRGKVVFSGSLKIGLDAQTGRLRSWHFDDDGGHGQALWVRDGNRWVLDAVGALADGTPAASVNVLTRVGPDEITWRSIDRVVADEELPDTVPVKLTRVPAGK